jgi:hypothetical protein
MLNYYKCVTSSSNVLGSISTQDFLSKIQYGDNYLNLIKEAREVHHCDTLRYKAIKRNSLPCYTLNFTFRNIRRDKNIIGPTGYIYLDIDEDININFNHPLLHASWLSLSGKGRGALVKVYGLTQDNFSHNYNLISNELGIESDNGARKKGQVNVLSYDPNLFFNDNSDYWGCQTNYEKRPHFSKNITPTIITTEMGTKSPQDIRYHNLNDLLPKIDFDGEDVHDLKEKLYYSKVKLPYNQIEENYRNSILSSIAYQIRALNQHIESSLLLMLMLNINNKVCSAPLENYEIEVMVTSIMKNDPKDLKPVINASRRFIYNKYYCFTTTQKRQIIINAMAADKVKKSKLKIEKAIKEWDFLEDGKITIRSLSKVAGMNKKTVQKYYHLYKSEIQLLNNTYYKKK